MRSYEELELVDDERLAELVQERLVEPLGFAGRAIESFSRHKKGITQLGGLAIGSIGFAAGAYKARHSH